MQKKRKSTDATQKDKSSPKKRPDRHDSTARGAKNEACLWRAAIQSDAVQMVQIQASLPKVFFCEFSLHLSFNILIKNKQQSIKFPNEHSSKC